MEASQGEVGGAVYGGITRGGRWGCVWRHHKGM